MIFGLALMRLFPEARVVHVYRDGRDTALSLRQHPAFKSGPAVARNMQRPGGEPVRRRPAQRPQRVHPAYASLCQREKDGGGGETLGLEAYGDLWSRLILSSQTYLSALPPERFFALRYEDMLQHPREKIRELIAFIDPSLADDAWLDAAARIPRPNPSKYPSLDAETQRRLTQACAPGLEALGYATCRALRAAAVRSKWCLTAALPGV